MLSGGGFILPGGFGTVTPGPSTWPDQNNTGLALHQGVPYSSVNYASLTVISSLLTVSASNVTYVGYDFRRRVTVSGSNVVFIGCRFKAPDIWMLWVTGGSGCQALKCEFDATGGVEDAIQVSSSSAGAVCLIQDCNIFGFWGDGGKVSSNTVVERCYIHDNSTEPAGQTPHHDGLQVMAGTNVLVTGCQIVANDFGRPSPQGDWTSALMMSADTGNSSNLRVIGNRLRSIGSNNIACYFWRDVTAGRVLNGTLEFKNNRVSSTANWVNGLLFVSAGVTMTDRSGNVDDATGNPVSV
jgi:hypothetical protein